MSIPKKPTGPSAPKGPIKPVAKPSAGAIKKPSPLPSKPTASPKPSPSASNTEKKAEVKKETVKPTATAGASKASTSAKETANKATAASKTAESKKTEAKKTTPPPSNQKEEKKKKKFGFLDFLFIFVVVALIGGNILTHHVGVEKEKELKLEISELQSKVNKIGEEMAMHENAASDYLSRLTSSKKHGEELELQITEQTKLLNEQKGKLGSLYARINNLKHNHEYDKGLIDSLTTELLGVQNKLVSLSKANEIKSLEIQTLKEQIAKGAAGPKIEKLIASEISITALSEKKGETIETEKAKKVTKMDVMFFLEEDKDIAGGLKTLYFRIVDPKGNTVGSNGSINLTASGSTVDYSFEGHVDYPLTGLESKLWIRPDGVKMKKGAYQIEIFNKDMQIGSYGFELK